MKKLGIISYSREPSRVSAKSRLNARVSLVAAAVGTMVGCSLVMGEVPAEDKAGLTDPDAGDSGVRDSSKWDTSSEADADAADSSVKDATAEVGPCADGAPEQAFFRDDDGDGHGLLTTVTFGCEPPSTGVWVTVGDDCQDDDPRVFKGQEEFFGDRPYLKYDGTYSYDFDCNGVEESGPSQYQAPPVCAGFLCGAKGFVETPERPGVGLRNRYCGSNTIRECVILTCTPVDMTTGQFFVCK